MVESVTPLRLKSVRMLLSLLRAISIGFWS